MPDQPDNAKDAFRQALEQHPPDHQMAPATDAITELLDASPPLPPAQIDFEPDTCVLTWRDSERAHRRCQLRFRYDRHVIYQLDDRDQGHAQGALTTKSPGWTLTIIGHLALASRAGIIRRDPALEIVRLADSPSLIQFSRTVAAVADLAERVQAPAERHWPAAEAVINALWPGWHSSWIPDGIESSMNSRIVINAFDQDQPRRLDKWILRALFQACLLAGAATGATPEETAAARTEIEAWLNSGQTMDFDDIGVALNTAQSYLAHLNGLIPERLAEPIPGREPPVSRETFRQELTLAILKAHQAGIKPLTPDDDSGEPAEPE